MTQMQTSWLAYRDAEKASKPPFSWKHMTRLAARSASEWVLPSSLLVRRVHAREPMVALTFDDGPDEHTPILLQTLRRFGLRATFFVLGASMRRWPKHVCAMLEDGHEVASHGYEHKAIRDMSARELARDLAMTQMMLPQTPRTRPLFRPPRGILSIASLAATTCLGYTVVLWSFDSLDHLPVSPEAVARRFEQYSLDSGEIVLFHEGEAATRAALPRVAAALHKRRLRPVTVSELLRSCR